MQYDAVRRGDLTHLLGRGIHGDPVVGEPVDEARSIERGAQPGGMRVRTRDAIPASARNSARDEDLSSLPWASTSTWSAVCSTSLSA